MEVNVKSELRIHRGRALEAETRAYELQFESFNGGNVVSSSSNNALIDEDPKRNVFSVKSNSYDFSSSGSTVARYRLMSPAKLPISRSPCLTISPGLSPTALLDSPVLLTNMKAEPSPTTGAFSKPQIMHNTFVSDSFSSPRDTSNGCTYDERTSSNFEFKLHTRPISGSGLSSLGPLASTRLNNQHCDSFAQVEGKNQSETFASSPIVRNENMAAASHELTLSVTAPNPSVHMVTSKASASAEVASDELLQRQGSHSGIQAMQFDHKGPSPLITTERSSEDGYNWRKYGQKHVKGCEFPRSYYKCTHPNCQVKKQLEQSQDGHITDIIYKGKHDHPKPQPSRRMAVGTFLSIQEEGSDMFSPLNNSGDKSSNVNAQTYHQIEPNGTPELSPVTASGDNIEGAGAQSNRILNEVQDDDYPEYKRRKKDIGVDVTPIGKVTWDSRVVVQTLSEIDILDDGYRWRKYGQKVVRGNPNPRSYYKCTNVGCLVRKHVERASHDPKSVITTYEGKHNHDVPAARTSAHDTTESTINNTTLNAMLRTRSEEIDTISLDLGVGISLNPENRSHEKQQTLVAGAAHSPSRTADPSRGNFIQGAPVLVYCGGVKDGTDQYGKRVGRVESFRFETRPVNHSYNPYLHNMGRLIMGP